REMLLSKPDANHADGRCDREETHFLFRTLAMRLFRARLEKSSLRLESLTGEGSTNIHPQFNFPGEFAFIGVHSRLAFPRGSLLALARPG
ncbi:MAG: hypothetical protein L0312_01310, partial [Acidobacteria bacterium]|nr:hypothetical protein [Acidobacteriota bacterium]